MYELLNVDLILLVDKNSEREREALIKAKEHFESYFLKLKLDNYGQIKINLKL